MTPEEVLLIEEGGYVEDCRGKVLKVTTSNPEYTYGDRKVYQFCYERLPLKLADYVIDVYEYFCHLLNKTYIYDKELTLEDGAICSARNCCSYIGKNKDDGSVPNQTV